MTYYFFSLKFMLIVLTNLLINANDEIPVTLAKNKSKQKHVPLMSAILTFLL